MRRLFIISALALALATLGATALQATLLPSGWRISPPQGAVSTTGTMPQGIALSPDGTKLAVVESGYNPAALRILSVPNLQTVQTIALKDAFGTPVWHGNATVLVAGGSTNAALSVHLATASVATATAAKGYVDAIAPTRSGVFPVVDADPQHAAAVVISGDVAYVANKAEATVTRLALRTREAPTTIAVDLHPAALALSGDGTRLFVACADADAIDVVDTKMRRVVQRIDLGLPQGPGASPNALALAPDGTLYVSLGAQNAVAEIKNGRVVARVPAGWYPSGIAVDAHNVYVANGKGEESRANPGFDIFHPHEHDYVAATLDGSVRVIPRSAFTAKSTQEVLANIPSPQPTPAQTIVRANGPIKHVIYVIKENRTYDQILGDVTGADGDPKLAMFGEPVTPNQHALVRRFGVFDNTDTDAQVSASGHNWSTAAFANDYVERFWPPDYGKRRDLYDFEDGAVAATPRNGYLWDDANAHGVSIRDYGEFVSWAAIGGGFVTTSMPGLKGKIDERYAGFNLVISDETRIDEWKKEFDGYVSRGDLPALEIVRLPNDHTQGTTPDALTPRAYIAQNDHAFGRLVDIVSHSKYWANTAIFAIEDDAQNGPDHVDNQRTTFYLVSPYAAPGVHHAHYSTSSVLHTMELLLGMSPMSIYDAVAPPIYDGFTTQPNPAPFEAIAPHVDVNETNTKTAYGAAASARMDFSRADDADEAKLNDILMHAPGKP